MSPQNSGGALMGFIFIFIFWFEVVCTCLYPIPWFTLFIKVARAWGQPIFGATGARLRAVGRATAAPRWGVPRQEPRAGVEECVAADCGQLWVPGNADQLGIYGWRWSFSFDIPFPSCHSLFSSTYSNHHFPYSDGKKVGWTKKWTHTYTYILYYILYIIFYIIYYILYYILYIIHTYIYISVVQLLGMHCTEIGLGLDGDRHRQRAPTAPGRTKFFGHGKGMAEGRGLLLQGRLPVDRVQQDSLRGRGAGWFFQTHPMFWTELRLDHKIG